MARAIAGKLRRRGSIFTFDDSIELIPAIEEDWHLFTEGCWVKRYIFVCDKIVHTTYVKSIKQFYFYIPSLSSVL
jgi:hypothetical protein